MLMYASRTGTRRNLAALRAHGWRLLVSPKGVLRTEGFGYALDNGAWTAFQQGEPFDGEAFIRAVDMLGHGADWLVVPDSVGDAARTFTMFEAWWPRIAGVTLLLFALQDGMVERDVEALLRPGLGLFVGGSTEWKERTAIQWGSFARRHGLYMHVGRVNTARRVHLAVAAGAHSIDGTSASRFAVTVAPLTAASRQMALMDEREASHG